MDADIASVGGVHAEHTKSTARFSTHRCTSMQLCPRCPSTPLRVHAFAPIFLIASYCKVSPRVFILDGDIFGFSNTT